MNKPHKNGSQPRLDEHHGKPLADPPPNIRCGDLGWPDVVIVVVVVVMALAAGALIRSLR